MWRVFVYPSVCPWVHPFVHPPARRCVCASIRPFDCPWGHFWWFWMCMPGVCNESPSQPQLQIRMHRWISQAVLHLTEITLHFTPNSLESNLSLSFFFFISLSLFLSQSFCLSLSLSFSFSLSLSFSIENLPHSSKHGIVKTRDHPFSCLSCLSLCYSSLSSACRLARCLLVAAVQARKGTWT